MGERQTEMFCSFCSSFLFFFLVCFQYSKFVYCSNTALSLPVCPSVTQLWMRCLSVSSQQRDQREYMAKPRSNTEDETLGNGHTNKHGLTVCVWQKTNVTTSPKITLINNSFTLANIYMRKRYCSNIVNVSNSGGMVRRQKDTNDQEQLQNHNLEYKNLWIRTGEKKIMIASFL